ncbi:MAG: hypothetical protein ACRDBF_13840, partial [Plesiomonas shigelloides]
NRCCAVNLRTYSLTAGAHSPYMAGGELFLFLLVTLPQPSPLNFSPRFSPLPPITQPTRTKR